MKPILFIDFHGTLSKSYFWRSLDSDTREKIGKFLFTEPNLATRDWMKGVYTSEEVNQMIAKEFNLDYGILWSHFVNDCKTMDVPKEILLKIQYLRKSYTVVLLTDNMDCFSRFTVPSLGLDRYFDRIANSAVEKILKNVEGGKWFLRLAEEYGASVKKCFLIDDSKHACKVFSSLGGTSLQVTNDQSLNYWLEKIVLR